MKIFRAAILTAKEVEFEAVRRHAVDERRVDDTFDGTVYRRAKIRRDLGSEAPVEQWDIAIYRTGRGQQPTTYGTQILLQHFRPDIVLYVGVAGGDPSYKDLSIGDIVVGKIVRYYERASQYTDNFIIKEESHSPNRALISAAEYEAGETNWLNRVEGDRPNSQVIIGEIASGEKVQKAAASSLWNAIKDRHPDVIAVETEGHGFHYAVAQSAGRGLMVRAISDLLDNKDDNTGQFGSDDERQSLASTRAAAFAINLIINLNTKFLEDIRESSAFRYAVILKISANNIEGVHRATRLLADAINDPHLTVESLQPANSFVLRVSTSLHSAAYARAIFSGGFISDLIGTEVTALESDVVRTGEPIFDAFLEAIVRGNAEMILIAEARLLDAYPAWHGAALALERMVIGRKERPVEKLGVEGQDAAVDKEWRALIEEIQEISSRLKINRSVLAKVVGISKVSISRAMHSQVRPSAYMFNQMETLLQRLKDKERPLGRRVSEMRMRAGISQGELARQLAISPSTISKIERGHANPNHRTMQLLEKMLKEHGFSS